MRITERALDLLPRRLQRWLVRDREAVKFIIVGGFCFVLTAVINYTLKLTILQAKPVTALTIATIIASFVSYALNRHWSFRTRGGRRRHHELALYVIINGIGVLINDVPLLVSRYVLHLHVPAVSRLIQEVSDFTAGMIIGTLLAMLFRLWAYRTFVFPDDNVRAAPQRRDRSHSAGTGR